MVHASHLLRLTVWTASSRRGKLPSLSPDLIQRAHVADAELLVKWIAIVHVAITIPRFRNYVMAVEWLFRIEQFEPTSTQPRMSLIAAGWRPRSICTGCAHL